MWPITKWGQWREDEVIEIEIRGTLNIGIENQSVLSNGMSCTETYRKTDRDTG